MIKAVLLLFLPVRTWEGIEAARRTFLFVLFVYLLPMVALSVAGEVFGRNWLTKPTPDSPGLPFPQDLAVRYGTAAFCAGLVMVLLSAWLVKSVSETFHNRHGFAHCFKLVTYSLGPFFLLRVLDAVPHISPWIPFSIGMICSASVFYYGIPYFLKPDPPHAFGVFLTGVILMTMAGFLTRFFTILVLQGKLHFHGVGGA
jgi:hypothetical protein